MKGGRIRDSKGINRSFKTIELLPKEINFDDMLEQKGQNIYMLAHQPGIGKTYRVMEYLKKKIDEDDDFTFFYFTDRHKTIEENIKGFTDVEVLHWEGFERIFSNKRAISLYNNFHLGLIRCTSSVFSF